MIDKEVKRIIDECYARAKQIIEEHEDVLHACAELLLEKANVTETPYTPEEYDEKESKEDDTLDDLEIVEEGEEGVAE